MDLEKLINWSDKMDITKDAILLLVDHIEKGTINDLLLSTSYDMLRDRYRFNNYTGLVPLHIVGSYISREMVNDIKSSPEHYKKILS